MYYILVLRLVNALRKGKIIHRLRRIVAMIISVLFGVMLVAAFIVNVKYLGGMNNLGTIMLYLGMTWFFLVVGLILISQMSMFSYIFISKEYKMMQTLPLSNGEIIAHKYTAVFLSRGFTLSYIVSMPIVYYFVFKISKAFFLFIMISNFLFVFLIYLAGLVLSMFLVRLVSVKKLKRKVAFGVSLALIFVNGLMFVYALVSDNKGKLVGQGIETMLKYSPTSVVNNIVNYNMQGHVWYLLLNIIALIVCVMLLMVVLFYLEKKHFFEEYYT